MVLWGWCALYHTMTYSAEPGWLSASELQQLDKATSAIFLGTNKLRADCDAFGLTRLLIRPKLHAVWHINADAQRGHRNPKAFWTFKEESNMGCLSNIACAVHAMSLAKRSLERWCLQLFNHYDPIAVDD